MISLEEHPPDVILMYGTPGLHEFCKGDYPDLTHVMITAQGGQGASATDGPPGLPCVSTVRFARVERLAAVHYFVVGAGVKSWPPGRNGKNGLVLIEGYTCGCYAGGEPGA